MITVNNLTLTYASGKGVFGLDFAVAEGEATGYLGPNGAGKTTTIRALLGFMKPDSGKCTVKGLDCIRRAPEIQKSLGYIPGEMTFPEPMNGDEFLTFMRGMRGMKDMTRQKQLLDMFELDSKGRIRKFSKGMKQKLGIVAAFMHDPEVLILDEPTSGLDPLMQNRFIELILSEKAREKTILMSSHQFEEVEKTCDHVIVIREGRIVAQSDTETLKHSRRSGFVIHPDEMETAERLLSEAGFSAVRAAGDTLEVYVKGEHMDQFIKTVARFSIHGFDARPQTLESVFMQFYGKEEAES